MGAKNNKKEEKKTKSFVDSNGNIRTVETTPEQDEMDKARDAAYEKYFKDKPTKKKAGGKIGMGMTKNNYKKGGSCSSKSYKNGGKVKRDGCAMRGKTKGRMV